MTVLRVYNPDTDTWDAVAVGSEGDPGPVGPAGPAGDQGPPGSGVQLRGAYYGTSTPLPSLPHPGDMWVLGPPVPVAAPDQLDGTPKEANDGIVWDDGTATWVNTGPLRGPRGTPGADGVGIPPGGTPGQILMKTGPGDYEVGWVTPS